jgi:iron complex transport system ATP-binding protein
MAVAKSTAHELLVMLTAQEISFYIANRSLLESIRLSVAPGEVLALVGPNGAGKSTLLKALIGEIFPTIGTVRMNARPLAAWSLKQRARCRAVLPQQSNLSFPFTVLEVVLMGRSPHSGGESAADFRIARQALATTEVDHLSERLYPTLSGGERQRVQLARVLAQIWQPLATHEPRYLLLDEPTTNLDLPHQHATLRLARQFARQGVGVLAVLHDLNLAAEYADQVAVLKQGRLEAKGAPVEVLTPSIISRTFNIPVMVIPHPVLGCPLVVPVPPDGTPTAAKNSLQNLTAHPSFRQGLPESSCQGG